MISEIRTCIFSGATYCTMISFLLRWGCNFADFDVSEMLARDISAVILAMAGSSFLRAALSKIYYMRERTR